MTLETEIIDIKSIKKGLMGAISEYCSEGCKAQCCRRGILPLSADNVGIVTQNRPNLAYKTQHSGFYLLDMSVEDGCPSLGESYRCLVYEQRPEICRDFPLRVDKENKIIFFLWCEAVAEGVLDLYLGVFKRLGYAFDGERDIVDVINQRIEGE